MIVIRLELALWTIRGVLPKKEDDPDRRWAQNVVLTVAGKSAEAAIATMRVRYDDLVVHGVQHQGLSTFLIDEKLLVGT